MRSKPDKVVTTFIKNMPSESNNIIKIKGTFLQQRTWLGNPVYLPPKSIETQRQEAKFQRKKDYSRTAFYDPAGKSYQTFIDAYEKTYDQSMEHISYSQGELTGESEATAVFQYVTQKVFNVPPFDAEAILKDEGRFIHYQALGDTLKVSKSVLGLDLKKKYSKNEAFDKINEVKRDEKYFKYNNLGFTFFDDTGKLRGMSMKYMFGNPYFFMITISGDLSESETVATPTIFSRSELFYEHTNDIPGMSREKLDAKSAAGFEVAYSNQQTLKTQISAEINSKDVTQLISTVINDDGSINTAKFDALAVRMRGDHNIDYDKGVKERLIQEFSAELNKIIPDDSSDDNLLVLKTNWIDYSQNFIADDELNNTKLNPKNNNIEYLGEHTLKNLQARIKGFKQTAISTPIWKIERNTKLKSLTINRVKNELQLKFGELDSKSEQYVTTLHAYTNYINKYDVNEELNKTYQGIKSENTLINLQTMIKNYEGKLNYLTYLNNLNNIEYEFSSDNALVEMSDDYEDLKLHPDNNTDPELVEEVDPFITLLNETQRDKRLTGTYSYQEEDIHNIISSLILTENLEATFSSFDRLSKSDSEELKSAVKDSMAGMYDTLKSAGDAFLTQPNKDKLFTLKDGNADIKDYTQALRYLVNTLAEKDKTTQKTNAQRLMENPDSNWLKVLDVVATTLFCLTIPIISWIYVALEAHASYKKTGSANYLFVPEGAKLGKALEAELPSKIFKQVMNDLKKEGNDEAQEIKPPTQSFE